MKSVLGMVCLLAVVALGRQPASANPTEIARGKYVFAATGGCGCHTEPGKNRVLNAGARKFEGPFGTVYSTNLTSDRETGLGGWSDEQIVAAIRLGRRPNGERILPVHPFTVFNGMAAEDLQALVAYLRTLPPVGRKTPPKKITVPLFESVFLPAWLAAFAPRETPPPTAPTTGLARGEYLVKAVGHCGECHSPRTMTMATDNFALPRRQPQGAGELLRPQYHAGQGDRPHVDGGPDRRVPRHRQQAGRRRGGRAHGRVDRRDDRGLQGHDAGRSEMDRPVPQDHPAREQQGRQVSDRKRSALTNHKEAS